MLPGLEGMMLPGLSSLPLSIPANGLTTKTAVFRIIPCSAESYSSTLTPIFCNSRQRWPVPTSPCTNNQVSNLATYLLRVNEQRYDSACGEVQSIGHAYEIQKHLEGTWAQGFREAIRGHEASRYVFHLNSTLLNCLTNSMSFVSDMLRALMMFRVFG